MKQRINITVDKDILRQIDELADKLGHTRSSFFNMAAITYMEQRETINMLPKLLDAYKKAEQEQIQIK